ncbi:MAG TPA: oligosaccharide flippase family protein [Baekduia sp.]|uniref:oligosaccharide flippase family protein n=1 Tax=Baekduia sp. TaxID=2600305 RepID=UPI002D771F9B|nr:oligosaccharide flippase family protein [Baekduia sp.]HET6509476.1 oligosaccharide flippase family protein [Baekduia sp.]
MADPDIIAAEDPLAGEDLAHRVTQGGLVRVVGFGLTNILAALTSIVLLRHLGVDEFGRYGTVMALMTIVNGVTDGGMNIAGTRELALIPAGPERRSLTGVILGIRIVLTIVGVGLAILFAVVAGYDNVLVEGTALAGVGIVMMAISAVLTLPLGVELRNTRLTLFELSKQVVALVATVAFVAGGASLLALLGVQTVVGVASVVAVPLIGGAIALVAPRYDRAEWIRIVRIALPVAIAGVLAVLYLRILVVMGSLMLSDRELGYLVTSARVIEVLSGLPLLVVSVALPVVSVAARDNPGRLRYVAQRLLESSLILGLLSALLLCFGAHVAVVVLGGSAYAGAAPVLAVQAFSLVTVFVTQSCVILLVALERQRDIVRGNLIGLAAVIVAGLVLLPAAGAQGGAIAALVADVVLSATMVVLLRRAGVGRELSVSGFARIGAAALPAAAAGTAVALAVGSDPIWPALATGVVFLVALVALRAVPPELYESLRRLRPAGGR